MKQNNRVKEKKNGGKEESKSTQNKIKEETEEMTRNK